MSTNGCLFDSYPVGDRMVSWIKTEGKVSRFEESWTPSIYVGSEREKLEKLSCNKKISSYLKYIRFVERYEKVDDISKSQVLELQLQDSQKIISLARQIESLESYGTYRLYNVDVPPVQSYFYDKDIFPLGNFSISHNMWTANDNVELTDYSMPEFSKMELEPVPKKQDKVAKFTDRIDHIIINDVILESESEEDLILECVKTIHDMDPDFIFTKQGDSFDFPYLLQRARQHGIQDKIILGRENTPLSNPKSKGTSYFSYGRIYYKPTGLKLQGRIHIDKSSCFIWTDDYDIHGLYEISRVCRLPLQTTARASIGKCMSSLQFYNATRRGLLVPWKPIMAEVFKSRRELMVADRGGLIFEPIVGVYENVAELDFASLFGTIMFEKNISAETILCKCCLRSEHVVPELGWHICKRQGIVPQSLEILLKKRNLYSKLLKEFPDNKIYESRKNALKWILVTSFGYLGFSNAKFGRIDAHIAVCAFARNLLLQAVRVAERNDFRILHGIVDSLWLYKKGATREQMEKLQSEIEYMTGFSMSLDVYKWLVFLESKQDKDIPVANSYFGAFENGHLKIRGIELRRHDTPRFFKRCQMEILCLMATANNESEIRELMPQVIEIYKKYLGLLKDHKVPIEELSFTSRASKNIEDYKSNSIQIDAMLQLRNEDKSIKAGQKVQYVITDYSRKTKRSSPLEMAGTNYDIKRYEKLLAKCCMTITKPFGIKEIV
ncbi:MAG TPA: DNA polymerase domain-containing protein [Verrucomicrobiae bacterium]|nr:DNA polymerase domain-containing protein [Verrucomicrobiae bacterium]